MNKRISWALSLVLGLSGIASMGWALGEIGGVEGGVYHNAVLVSEPLQFGDIKATVQRNSIGIPEDYGKLITITPSNGQAVLWFTSDEGVVRNVIVSGDQLWLIQRSGRLVREK